MGDVYIEHPPDCDIEYLKVGKAEGCLDCRLRELNGQLSPRLQELERRGTRIDTPRPWCGSTDWILWGARRVESKTVARFEADAREGQGIFVPARSDHFPRPNGEIFACIIFEELGNYLSDVYEAHGGGEDADRPTHNKAWGKSYDALGEYLARAFDMDTTLEDPCAGVTIPL